MLGRTCQRLSCRLRQHGEIRFLSERTAKQNKYYLKANEIPGSIPMPIGCMSPLIL